MKEVVFFSCLLVSIWPTVIWCFQRYTDRSDDPFGIVALLALVLIVAVRRKTETTLLLRKEENDACSNGDAVEQNKDCRKVANSNNRYLATAMALTAYCISIPTAGKTVQAFFALTVLGFALSVPNERNFQKANGKFLVGDWILLYLVLPVIASLNFYVGYPLRLVVTELASMILRCEGFKVVAQSTMLVWHSQLTEVDAPCSGIKMLWFAAFAAASLSSIYKLNASKTGLLFAASVFGAILTNVFRVTSLFIIENHLVILPNSEEWHGVYHQAIGASVFMVLIGIISLIGWKLSQAIQPARTAPVGAANGFTFFNSREIIYMLCALALILQLPVSSNCFTVSNSLIQGQIFPGWPKVFEGKSIHEVPKDEVTREFSRDFPGEIGVFTDGRQTICLRWIARETRQLHPSADCYRGLGYAITFEPSIMDSYGNRWNKFLADRETTHLHIRERIFDLRNNNWHDVSSWYWSALLQKTSPPWWSVTVVSR